MAVVLAATSEWVVFGVVAVAAALVAYRLYRSVAGKSGCTACRSRDDCSTSAPSQPPGAPDDGEATKEN